MTGYMPKNLRTTKSASVYRELRLMWPIIAGAVGLIVLSAAVFWAASRTDNTALGTEVRPTQLPAGVPVRVSVSQLPPGRLLTLQIAGKQVPLVVMRSASGVVRAALASCRVCYEQHQQNEFHEFGVVCARCRKRMNMPGPHDPDKKLACDLVKVPYRVEEDGDVLISHDDLSRADRFLSDAKSSR